jgi:hypothetical protein
MILEAYAAVRIQSLANARMCWQARSRLTRSLRRLGGMLVAPAARSEGLLPVSPPGLSVTLTRIAHRALDSDNLAAAFKPVRDGVADALCVDDGSPLVEWLYAQRRATADDTCLRGYGMVITIRRRA